MALRTKIIPSVDVTFRNINPPLITIADINTTGFIKDFYIYIKINSQGYGKLNMNLEVNNQVFTLTNGASTDIAKFLGNLGKVTTTISSDTHTHVVTGSQFIIDNFKLTLQNANSTGLNDSLHQFSVISSISYLEEA